MGCRAGRRPRLRLPGRDPGGRGFDCFIGRPFLPGLDRRRTVAHRFLGVRACLAVLLPVAVGTNRLQTDAKEARDDEVAGMPWSWGRAIPQM